MTPAPRTYTHPQKGRRTRSRASLEQRLHELLDDGTGRIHPALQVLADQLIAMPEPGRGLVWINNNPQVPTALRGLARGEIALTHEALHALPSPRTTAHLRDLLMQAGALPHRDRQLLLLEQWAHHQLAALPQPEHARLLRRFLTWGQLPALRAAARRRPLSTGSRNGAAVALTAAHRFLVWLHDHDRTLHQLRQADLDLFHTTTGPPPQLHRFLRWAMRNQHMPRLRLPPLATPTRAPITQHRRLALIRSMLTDPTIDLSTRVAALLLLLFAQPVSTLLRLTIHDLVEHDDGQLLLRLGSPPTPVPEPFAALLRQLRAARPNMNTAANPDSSWLFPGGRAGEPLNPSTIRHRFQALQIPTTQARTAAFRQLVLQAPAPVIADALGYHANTAQRHHAEAGGTWHRYPTTRT